MIRLRLGHMKIGAVRHGGGDRAILGLHRITRGRMQYHQLVIPVRIGIIVRGCAKERAGRTLRVLLAAH